MTRHARPHPRLSRWSPSRWILPLGPGLPAAWALTLAGCLLTLLPGCASSGTIRPTLPSGVQPDEAAALAEADLEAGRDEDALVLLTALLGERNLAPELRNEADLQAERAVAVIEARMRLPEGDGAGPLSAEELQRLARLDLPLAYRARLAVAAGRAHLQEGSRIRAYKYLRDFERDNPGHPEGVGAGEVLADAGFSLIQDPRRYALLRRYSSRGLGALELLVLRYPSHPRCAEAYQALADAYEDRGDLDRAIERLEDLLLYHPRDLLAPAADARLPRLRMARVERDDFDRFELERAREELQAWEQRYGDGLEVVDENLRLRVQRDLATCSLRLASNDLVVARYHRRIDQPFGPRQHAERAAAMATAAEGELPAVEDGPAAERLRARAAAIREEVDDLMAWAQRVELESAGSPVEAAAPQPSDRTEPPAEERPR